MASLGSVYMIADRRWGKLESAVERMEASIGAQVSIVVLKLDAHAKLFDEHAKSEQGWMLGIDQHLRILNGHVFEHHGEIGRLKGTTRNGT